jgi:isocitrate dehydrogenase
VPCDISVAGRILAAFPEYLSESQREPDNLAYLGQLALQPSCIIVKLPNISAPINQIQDCITELRLAGYNVPLYPTDEDLVKDPTLSLIRERYQKISGSAVNPVLREGNSDRRVAPPVKAYAQKNPHRMGLWSKASRTHVAHMASGDFYETELSTTVPKDTSVSIELIQTDGTVVPLRKSVSLVQNEVIDAACMRIAELRKFYAAEMDDAANSELLLSLHLKATMMKVSDPIMFGHCIEVFFENAWEKHKETLSKIGITNAKSGLSGIYNKIKASLPKEEAAVILSDFEACFSTHSDHDNDEKQTKRRPWLAMVDSDKGISNLHVPNDIIIDASMPVVVRDSGKMYNQFGEMEDTKCLIPDRCYATVYQEVISYVKTKGQFDVSTMGNVANVGLMAQKAEEYGSHDKTFEISAAGQVVVRDLNSGEVYFTHTVEKGDIWRMCQTKDIAIRDWVKLATARARATGSRTIFWLDPKRAHDAVLIAKVRTYLQDHNTDGLDIRIMRPVDAVRISMERATDGLDTISVTGNVLRDYLTDLFPILELGTSAKMLSIVPLLAGGGLFETGAGGSAPKHVQQFVKEGHLRWDSLGEYLAMAAAYEKLAENAGNDKAAILGDCLNKAVGRILNNRKSPSRTVNQIDNRATNFYVALYWANFLAEALPLSPYVSLSQELGAARTQIVSEFKASQGSPVDLGGYYFPDPVKTKLAMNPSHTMNTILAKYGPVV